MSILSRRVPSMTVSGPAILFTNNALAGRGGTELYIRDLAFALKGRGYRPMAYSQRLGEVCDELRAGGVAVVDSLDELPQEPDLIHAHHHIESLTAMLAFPTTPAVYVCHGTGPWEEHPPRTPSIRVYVAVSESTRDLVVSSCKVARESVIVLPNFVDLARFPGRAPLPDTPKSVLVMSNHATLAGFAGVIATECAQRGFECTIRGLGSGSPINDPAEAMAHADVVVAAGRTALEAMATGCAVIVADDWGLGGLVTTENFDVLRRGNFGVHTARTPLSGDTLSAELDCYDAADARLVQSRVRSSASLSSAVDCWEAIYVEAIETAPGNPTDLSRAAADYLAAQAPWIKEGHRAAAELESLGERLGILNTEAASLQAEAASLQAEAASLQAALNSSESRALRLEAKVGALEAELTSRTGIRGASRNLRRAMRDRAARTLRSR